MYVANAFHIQLLTNTQTDVASSVAKHDMYTHVNLLLYKSLYQHSFETVSIHVKFNKRLCSFLLHESYFINGVRSRKEMEVLFPLIIQEHFCLASTNL